MGEDQGDQRDGESISQRSVPPKIEVTDGTSQGEPLVHDFVDKYIPKEFQPEQSAGPSAAAHISDLQISDDEDGAPPPPDLSRRGIHIPSRTSSATIPSRILRHSGSSVSNTPESREKSSFEDSVESPDTSVSSTPKADLPALQVKPIEEAEKLAPLAEDDPFSFDLVIKQGEGNRGFSLEKRSEQLFSREHLEEIFADPSLMLRFTSYLSRCRPHAIPLLIYYLDSLKALRAVNYANAVADALQPLQGHDFTQYPARQTVNSILEDKSQQAFEALVRDELPAYIGHVFVQYVSMSVQRRITGTLPPHLREASEGLAEVFCLTDPSRPDNPIVFASEEFHRTTQYGVSYAIGRNCRFLQGPRTNPFSHQRLGKAVEEEREHSEVFLNYRRDGSPFMNLLMIAPLFDSRGKLRYFIGAQVDVSGLVKEATDLDALQRLLAREEAISNGERVEEKEKKDEFQELSEMLNSTELEIVRKYGGSMHREHIEEADDASIVHRSRIMLKEPSPDLQKSGFQLQRASGKLEGIYQNYLLLRPYPSLRILFASPALRVPGLLQSSFMSRIGGSARVRDELTAALAAARGVTAKVRWIPSPVGNRYSSTENVGGYLGEEGRARWIHCTPLLGANGAVGVWMVVCIDEDGSEPKRRFKVAPPVANSINGAGALERRRKKIARSISSEGDVDGGGVEGPVAKGDTAARIGGEAHGMTEYERKRLSLNTNDGDGSLVSFAL